jgi:hypothetical protein
LGNRFHHVELDIRNRAGVIDFVRETGAGCHRSYGSTTFARQGQRPFLSTTLIPMPWAPSTCSKPPEGRLPGISFRAYEYQ